MPIHITNVYKTVLYIIKIHQHYMFSFSLYSFIFLNYTSNRYIAIKYIYILYLT